MCILVSGQSVRQTTWIIDLIVPICDINKLKIVKFNAYKTKSPFTQQVMGRSGNQGCVAMQSLAKEVLDRGRSC